MKRLIRCSKESTLFSWPDNNFRYRWSIWWYDDNRRIYFLRVNVPFERHLRGETAKKLIDARRVIRQKMEGAG